MKKANTPVWYLLRKIVSARFEERVGDVYWSFTMFILFAFFILSTAHVTKFSLDGFQP